MSRKYLRYTAYLILLDLVLILSSMAQNQGYTDGIVAVVNDDVITVYDVATYNAEFEQKLKKSISEEELSNLDKRQKMVNEINAYRIKAAHDLINEKLIYAEFKKKGYQFPTELVDKRIDSIVNSYTGGDWGKFEDMLIESNTSMVKFREKIERKLAVDILINQTIDKNINISPYEIETYYRENIDKYSEPGKVLLQIITITPDEFQSIDDYKKRVDTVAIEIRNGTDFSELAKKYSHDSSSKGGGELGWINQTDVRVEFKNALGEMKKNSVSDAFVLNGSTFFIKVADVIDGVDYLVSDVYDDIKRILYNAAKKGRYESYIQELRSKAFIRVFFQE